MTKRLFIAEKPSMGKAIAAELSGATQNTKTHVTVGDDTVTWCFGHLLELAPPQSYDPKYERWNFDDLPILPGAWKMQISGDKKDQVNAIKALLKECDEVIHAGDPGREGQLIVDELLHYLGNKKPVKRILLNALDSQSIKEALNAIEPNQKFLPLFVAGQARSHADWVMGMNLTRAYTVLGRRAGYQGVLSVGRVQTPTLAIVVKRDLDIENFIPKDYWVPIGHFNVAEGQFTAKWTKPSNDFSAEWLDEADRIVKAEAAQKIAQKCQGKLGKVSKFEEKPKKIESPLPYSLSTMQTYANSKWGVTASDTLKICQELYEAKLTSYPRTDCNYLPTNQLVEVDGVMNAIKTNMPTMTQLVNGADTSLRSGAWNDKKLSEHHAIIPTRLADSSALGRLGETHRKIYDAIVKRYLSQFYPDCDARVTTVDVEVEQEKFHATGQRIVSPGWKVVYGAEENEDADDDKKKEDDEQLFPKITQGENANCTEVQLKASKTTPPARFNDGSLIRAMTNVHQLVNDPESKAKLKDVKGIGTEATRANIIETLVARGFFKRDKKALISTPIGRAMIQTFPPRMVDPALTAMWENAFEAIARAENNEQAKVRYQTFMDKQSGWVKQLITIAPSSDFSKLPVEPKNPAKELAGHGTTCPKCQKGKMVTRQIKTGKMKGKTFLGCSNYPACSHSEWPK